MFFQAPSAPAPGSPPILPVSGEQPPARSPDEIASDAIDHLMRFEFSEIGPEEMSALMQNYVIPYGARVALALIILIIAWTLAGWVSSLIDTSLRKLKFDATLTKFLSRLARWLVLLLAGLMCLSYFGVETTSFAAVIGAAGLAIGLAFQGTLSNFAAGAMLLLFRPFKVGDAVNIAGQTGIIDELSIFTTSMDTFDNRRIIIPNGEIFGSVIENITFHSIRRVDGDVGIAYSADIDETRRVLENVAASVEGTVSTKDPAIVLLGLGASSVDWSVRIWAPTSEYLAVKQRLLREIKMQLDDASIGIPFPQMDIHVHPDAA